MGSSDYEVCSSSQIDELCGRHTGDGLLSYKVDEGYEYYFDNWYVQMGLVCMTPLQIAMLASDYFIGYCLGGSLFWLPDKIGRKKSVIFSMSLSMLAETVMIFASGYYTRMSCFFFMGLF